MNEQEIKQIYQEFIIGSYKRDDIVFVKGKGSYLWDINGKKYIDFFPGWAVSGLGHCPQLVVKSICKQAKTLMHLSNNFYHPWQAQAAKKIIDISFNGKVFFCNSGAEANEAAIKLCRIYGMKKGKYKFISLKDSFHGRSLATVTLTGQEKYSLPFKPLPEGFSYVPINDFSALNSLVDDKTSAIFIEIIQGEGGINVVEKEYLQQIRNLCDEKDILLVFDEVQTGFGRTGKFFAYQNYEIEPDIMTLAKTLGGGFPVGAMIARNEIADLFVPGTHASTFGGNPLASSSIISVIETIINEKLLKNVNILSPFFKEFLENLKEKFPVIKEIRGIGFMQGMELKTPGEELVEICRQKGLLINCTHSNVIRIMPAINIKKPLLKKGLKILENSLKEFSCFPEVVK
ncbi:MAG: aspartate aminotransferase family protein [Candidatus Omnitrophica bacterium]|jgi:predicted acetylornithine/succinylornithine family transaminase|nr:aspartate aminotransferase family protein [Candidatus Omnitrophota bacterium]